MGVYAFCLGVTTYFLGQLSKWVHLNFIVVLGIVLVGVSLIEIEVYWIYSLINKATMSFQHLLTWRLPPTLILNGSVTVLLFFPFRRFLLRLIPDQPEE